MNFKTIIERYRLLPLLALFAVFGLTACEDDLGTGPGGGGGGGFSVVQGNASISWPRPSTREGGGGLAASDISGYRVYYGSKPGEYQEFIEVSGANSLQLTLQSIPAGTYYVAITTVDTKGRESLFSKEFTVDVK